MQQASTNFQESGVPMHIDEMSNQQLKNLIKNMQTRQIDLSRQIEQLSSTEQQMAESCEHFRTLRNSLSELSLTPGECVHIKTCNVANLNHELEQKVAERTQALEDSQHQLSAILNAVPDAVVTFNSEGRIMHVNQAAEQILAYEKDSMLGLNIRQLISDTHQHDFDAIVQQLAHNQYPSVRSIHRSEISVFTRSGEPVSVSLYLARVDHQDKFTAILRDIRKIRALQREVLNATEAERSRISQELHDSLGQDLVGISMLARSVAAEHENRGSFTGELADLFLYFSRTLDNSISDLRQIIFDLAPLEMSDGGLKFALKKLVEFTNKNNNIQCKLSISGTDDSVFSAGSEQNIQLLRIAREAVHNALKHAQADTIDISLQLGKDIRLSIADDGVGMPMSGTIEPSSQGIRIMHYRAQVLGGKLQIEPNLPRGTCVTCVMSRGE